jgi:Na+-transporting methylmalonyl-CoA/oxaloacetate decarboxylase gamma subunit
MMIIGIVFAVMIILFFVVGPCLISILLSSKVNETAGPERTIPAQEEVVEVAGEAIPVVVYSRPCPERYDNYGRPQQIPAEVRARLRREWDAIGRRLPGQPNDFIKCACGCGGELLRFDENGRPRKYLFHHSWRKGRKGGWQ